MFKTFQCFEKISDTVNCYEGYTPYYGVPEFTSRVSYCLEDFVIKHCQNLTYVIDFAWNMATLSVPVTVRQMRQLSHQINSQNNTSVNRLPDEIIDQRG